MTFKRQQDTASVLAVREGEQCTASCYLSFETGPGMEKGRFEVKLCLSATHRPAAAIMDSLLFGKDDVLAYQLIGPALLSAIAA